MNIVFDNIIYALQRAGGISVVWTEILKRSLLQTVVKPYFIDYTGVTNIFRDTLHLPSENISARRMCPKNLNRYFSPPVNLKGGFIFHSSYYRTCKNPNAINVTTVHDFTYEYFAHGLTRKIHMWQKNAAIRKSDYIVCISENTKNDLMKFLPDVDESKIRVIYNGVSEDYYHNIDLIRPQLKDCVLFVGNRAGCKNFRFTVEALKDTKHRLLLCGKPLSSDEENYLKQNLGDGRYNVVTDLSDEELNILYNSVFCLAFPSSYEGFGIPVIEAQKAGCPVIAYNNSSIPEIIGDKYPILKTLSIDEFHQLLTAFEGASVRDEVIKLGLENSSRFSWDATFAAYLGLYKEIADKYDCRSI